MKSKKGVFNNVFVYLLSIVIVVFCGFLVMKFVLNFSGDAKTAIENNVLDELKSTQEHVYSTFGSESIEVFRFSSEVEMVCFVEKSCNSTLISNLNTNQKNSLNSIIEGSDNVALFDNSDIISSSNIGEFKVQNPTGCFCVKPKNNRVNLIFSNERNVVYIKENN